ncbi:MAG TPA: c-type cytochrome [Gammaproteobacteria bacterium]|nr:c-type cytochrome [Gammaproteobacteria bacterium]
MKATFALFFGALASLASAASAQSLAEQLAWAYAITPGPAPPAPADDGTRYSLDGSEGHFTLDQIRNRMGPADWYPGDHPAMPPIVAKGREAAGIWACSLCHYPNGKGRPENAGVAGLPKQYFIQQMHDFKNGLRASADSRKPNTPIMAGFAVQMTDEEIEQAADYFGAMRWTPWIQVVETDTVPKTRISGGMHLKLEGAEAGTEPLGNRIVESPVNAEHTELLRDPRSSFIAYVPKGSVGRGKELALYGNEGVTACTVCHGQDLNGLAIVPTLRGRSPSYIARQLADMKAGKRNGAWTPLMAPVVASLGSDDILNLAAYLASLEPMP